MMHEIPISSKGPSGGNALFCKTRKEMHATSGRSSPVTSCTLVLVQKRVGILKCIQITQKENVMNWQSKLRMCDVQIRIQYWKDVSISRKRNVVKTCTSTPVNHQERWWWISSVQPMTSDFFERNLRLSWKDRQGRSWVEISRAFSCVLAWTVTLILLIVSCILCFPMYSVYKYCTCAFRLSSQFHLYRLVQFTLQFSAVDCMQTRAHATDPHFSQWLITIVNIGSRKASIIILCPKPA